MKRTLLSIVLLIISIGLVSCGHDHGGPSYITTQILSDPVYDGDIVEYPADVFTISQTNTQSVFAGIDPVTFAEYRAFLDFPLGGAGGIPLDAVIVSATLDIVIDSIRPLPLNYTIPIRIDLVSFQPPTLVETDFSRTLQPALASTTIAPPISQTDLGNHVFVDVTSLMREAQRLGLPDFQVRIMEDLGIVSPGLIEINDTTGSLRGALAPLLEITYY
jgi:hypothetical protein